MFRKKDIHFNVSWQDRKGSKSKGFTYPLSQETDLIATQYIDKTTVDNVRVRVDRKGRLISVELRNERL